MSSPEMDSASTTPFTESRVSTPATSVDLPSDDTKKKDYDMPGHEDKDHDGADTPRKPDVNSGLLESQLQKLQVRLAELEQQAERDRREREAFGARSAEETIPFLLTDRNLDSELLRFMRNEFSPKIFKKILGYRQLMRDYGELSDEDDDSGPPGSRYLARAIRTLNRQLAILQTEKDKVCKISSDRDRLLEMEQKWEVEREELLQKQHELQQLEVAISPPLETQTSAAWMDQEAPTQEDPPEEPELNGLNWQAFKLQVQSSLLLPTYAIDVLIGDPVVTWESPFSIYSSFSRIRSARPHPMATEEFDKPRKRGNPAKDRSIMGQAPVPERIRINSKHIIRILEKIHGESLTIPTVMIRPYKALAYYDEAIRLKLQKLEAKFGQSDHDTRDVTTADPSKEPDVGAHAQLETVETLGLDEDDAGSETKGTGKGDEPAEDEEEDEFTSSPAAYEHLKCLVRFMDERLRTKIAYLSSDRCQTVSFSDVWYLFKPGDEVIEQSKRQVYRIIGISSAPHKVFSPYRTSWDKKERAQEDTPVVLICVYIDFDGKELGPMVRKVRIARFDGEKPVTALEVYPLRFAEERKMANEGRDGTGGKGSKELLTLRDKIIARGRMFLDVTSFKHMHYSGLTLDTRDEVDSHVVVDFEEAFSRAAKKMEKTDTSDSSKGKERGSHEETPDAAERDWRPTLNILIGPSLEEDFGEVACTAACCVSMRDAIHKDAYAEKKRNQDYMALLRNQNGQRDPPPTVVPRLLAEIKEQGNSLSPEELLIMSYRVFGFVLRTRKWAQLNLDHLRLPEDAVRDSNGKVDAGVVDIPQIDTERGLSSGSNSSPEAVGLKQADGIPPDKHEDKTAFGQLVLPDGHKEMVKSLITQHFRDKDSASKVDIVRGKGKGLIILLHGAPGVGKTTTAEGVAEIFQKPLFQITCGDLGTSAPEVEKALESHFSLANRWGCILLLDEADVFLAARSKEDFKRNGLVSVFLRVLEYYAGILFLTTNRVGDFDEAFASRIHISLYYPQLTDKNTEAIFRLNLRMISDRFERADRKIKIETEEIIAYAMTYFKEHPEEQWNGRQIRNACQTALALAEYRAQGDSHLNAADPSAEVELKVKDLDLVSTAYLQFMRYLNKIRGKDAEMWAKGMKLRAREIDVLLYAGSKDSDRSTSAEEKKPAPTTVTTASRPATEPADRLAATTPRPPSGSPYPAPARPPPTVSQAGAAAPPPPGPPPGAQQQQPHSQGYNAQPSQGYPQWQLYSGYGAPPQGGSPQPTANTAGYLPPTLQQGAPPLQPPGPWPPYNTPEYALWYQQQQHQAQPPN